MFETYECMIEKQTATFILHTTIREDEKIINILKSIDGIVNPYYAKDYEIIFKIGKCFDSKKINDEITRRIHEYLNNLKSLKTLFDLKELTTEDRVDSYFPKFDNDIIPRLVTPQKKLIWGYYGSSTIMGIDCQKSFTKITTKKFFVKLKYYTNTPSIIRSAEFYTNAKNTIDAQEIALQKFPNAQNIVINEG